MTKNGRYFTGISIGVATVWFSTHCGAGFASGTQELIYFANHGWFSIFLPILSFIVIGITYYVGLETARQTDKWDYIAWSKEAYGKGAKILTPLMDIAVILTTIAASAATIAAGGELGKQYLNLPVFVGSMLMLILVTLLCIFGEKLVRKNAMIMTSAILIIILIVIVAGLIKFSPDISRLFSEKFVNPEAAKWSITGRASDKTSGNFFNAMLWALTYAGFQTTAIGGITSSFKGAKYKSEAKGAMILGSVLNMIMLVSICLLIFSQMPSIYTNPDAAKLPTVFIVNSLEISALKILYPMLLFLALITTAVGFVFGMVSRVEPYAFKNMKNQTMKKAIISVATLIVCYLVSQFGLMKIVGSAYRYLGIYNWIFMIIPLWIIGYKNIKKRNKSQIVK